jgi:hypothetical protein
MLRLCAMSLKDTGRFEAALKIAVTACLASTGAPRFLPAFAARPRLLFLF